MLREEYPLKTQGADQKNSMPQGEQIVLRRYISVSSPLGIAFLLACCYAYETKRPMVLTEEIFGKGEIIVGYLRGYLVASEALGLVSVTANKDDSWTVDAIYEGFNLKEEVLEAIKRVNDTNIVSDETKEMLKKAQERIEKFFKLAPDEIIDV